MLRHHRFRLDPPAVAVDLVDRIAKTILLGGAKHLFSDSRAADTLKTFVIRMEKGGSAR